MPRVVVEPRQKKVKYSTILQQHPPMLFRKSLDYTTIIEDPVVIVQGLHIEMM